MRRQRVVVDVQHASAGLDPLSDLANVPLGGQAGTDIRQLGDARLRRVGDSPARQSQDRTGLHERYALACVRAVCSC
jgi:hypothetical protein